MGCVSATTKEEAMKPKITPALVASIGFLSGCVLGIIILMVIFPTFGMTVLAVGGFLSFVFGLVFSILNVGEYLIQRKD
jgi:hypothetical protein